MKFTKDLNLGFRSYLQSVGFVLNNGFIKYLIVPLLLFGIIFYFGHQFGSLSEQAGKAIEGKEYTWGFIGLFWLHIKVQFYALLKFLFIDATKYLVMMFLSPLLAILSEKTEEILTGNKYKFNFKQLIIDVKRGIGIAIRMLLAEFGLVYWVWYPICSLLGVTTSIAYVSDNRPL